MKNSTLKFRHVHISGFRNPFTVQSRLRPSVYAGSYFLSDYFPSKVLISHGTRICWEVWKVWRPCLPQPPVVLGSRRDLAQSSRPRQLNPPNLKQNLGGIDPYSMSAIAPYPDLSVMPGLDLQRQIQMPHLDLGWCLLEHLPWPSPLV